jgi:hypothetical protein
MSRGAYQHAQVCELLSRELGVECMALTVGAMRP